MAAFALAALLVAYAPAWRVPFLLDDQVAILENTSIQQGPFSAEAWRPPGDGNTVQGRPVLNASFAASHALGGDGPALHRAVNLGIHALNALLLGVLLWLVLRSPRWARQTGEQAALVAAIAAALWALHPLQTLSVTYVAQRAESLASFFYLATLVSWFSARRSERARTALLCLAATSCALGMLTKEIVVTAPFVVFVLDRLLYPGAALPRPFRLALGGLIASWGLLLWMLAANDFARGGSTGTAVITRSQYLLTQLHAIPLYVSRIFWPAGIVFDHGQRIVTAPRELVPAVLGWLLLLALLAALLRREARSVVIALGLFFVLLSPTSSLVPVASQTIAEHRIYLASAIVIAAGVAGADRVLRRRGGTRALVLIGAVTAMALATLTFRWNRDLQDPLALWEDVAVRAPANWRAHSNLAAEYAKQGRDADALVALDRSLALAPGEVRSLYNRANARRRLGDSSGAEADYRRALALDPSHAEARNNLAMLLQRRGDLEAALRELEALVARKPEHASAWYNLAWVRFQRGEDAASHEAVEAFLRLRSDSARGWHLAADVLERLGDPDASRSARERAAALEAETGERPSRSAAP